MKKRGIITFEGNAVSIPNTEIWMTAGEIAGLFHVRGGAVTTAIRRLLKEGIVKDYESHRCVKLAEDYEVDVYNMEIIIALSFKFDTGFAFLFRRWLLKTASRQGKEPIVLFLHHARNQSC